MNACGGLLVTLVSSQSDSGFEPRFNERLHHCLLSSFDKWPGCELGVSGVRIRARGFLSSPKVPDQLLGSLGLPLRGNRPSVPKIMRPGREADHSPASSAEDKKGWSYTLKPHKVSSSILGPCKGYYVESTFYKCGGCDRHGGCSSHVTLVVGTVWDVFLSCLGGRMPT